MPNPEVTPALSWVKQIPRSLFLQDQIPLIGAIPSIPLKQWTESLKIALGFNDLEITVSDPEWTESVNFFRDIPKPKIFSLGVPGIAGNFFLSFPTDSLTELTAILLTGDEKNVRDVDAETQDGFTRFLLNEALYSLQKSGIDEKIMPALIPETQSLPKDSGLLFKVEVKADGKTIPCRLIFTKEFQTSISEEFKPEINDLYLKSPLSEKIELTVSFEAARFKMKPKEFRTVAPGDFIVLDHCSIDPEHESGSCLLKVFNLPFFSGELKDGKVTLREVAKYYERDANMQSENPEKDGPEDFELEEFEDDLQEFSDEELEELDKPTEVKEEGEEEVPETPATKKKETATQEAPIATPKTASEMLSAGDIPLSLSIELGRVNISLNKLIGLAPGNILEINAPKEGVDLVLNGKKVAEGELLKIGDVFGIRITNIGH